MKLTKMTANDFRFLGNLPCQTVRAFESLNQPIRGQDVKTKFSFAMDDFRLRFVNGCAEKINYMNSTLKAWKSVWYGAK